jgi:hypothetical protein
VEEAFSIRALNEIGSACAEYEHGIWQEKVPRSYIHVFVVGQEDHFYLSDDPELFYKC